jgi:hypothetical protein
MSPRRGFRRLGSYRTADEVRELARKYNQEYVRKKGVVLVEGPPSPDIDGFPFLFLKRHDEPLEGYPSTGSHDTTGGIMVDHSLWMSVPELTDPQEVDPEEFAKKLGKLAGQCRVLEGDKITTNPDEPFRLYLCYDPLKPVGEAMVRLYPPKEA